MRVAHGYQGPIECLPELVAACDGKRSVLQRMLERELADWEIEEVCRGVSLFQHLLCRTQNRSLCHGDFIVSTFVYICILHGFSTDMCIIFVLLISQALVFIYPCCRYGK